MDFKDKTVWITGASSGIGKAVALQLANECEIVIVSGRNKKQLDDVAQQVMAKGATAKVVAFDLANEIEIVKAFKEVEAMQKKVDALLQFGGVSHRSLVVETDPDVERKVMEVNYFGTVMLAKIMLRQMIKNGGGLLAATSSIVGKFGFPQRSSYSAAKHALHGYFETIRAENVQNNIAVSLIIPGRVATNVSKNALLKDGKKHNVMDNGIASGMDVNKAAQLIIKKLRNEKKEILVGGKELMMVYLRRWFPHIAYKMASKVNPT